MKRTAIASRLLAVGSVCIIAAACGSRADFSATTSLGTSGAGGEVVQQDASGDTTTGTTVGSPAVGAAPTTAAIAAAGGGSTAVGTTPAGSGVTSTGISPAAGSKVVPGGSSTAKTGTAKPRATAAAAKGKPGAGKSAAPKASATTAAASGAATLSPVNVGFIIQDASGAGSVLGTNASFTTNARQQATAQYLVDYENAHGGLAGHKINPIFDTIKATTTDAERVTDCQSLIQDDHVAAVIDTNTFLEDDDWACFAQGHVNYFGNVTGSDTAFMDANAPYIATTYLGLDHQMAAMAQGASQVKFFTPGGTVGIILPDTVEAHNDFISVLQPALTKIGVTKTDVKYISPSTGGSQTSQTDSAELEFSTDGIKQVLFFHDIIVYLQFTSQASTQNFFPQYAYPDFEGAAGVAAFYGSSQTNTGSIAVSSEPPVIQAKDPGSAGSQTAIIDRNSVNAGWQNCFDILSKQSGVNWYDPSQSQDPTLDAIYTCDELFLYVAAADKVGPTFTPASIGAGLKALGNTYQTPVQFSTDFSSGHTDGADSYEVGKYATDCKCFVAATPPTKLS